MKAPMNWLRDYVDIDMPGAQYARRMIMTGTGVEGVEPVAGDVTGIVVGHVLTCADHPDSDHLHVLTVDVGEDAPLQIVCGAPNVAAGQRVVVARIGATLPGGVTIKRGKLRGVESEGMVCSGPELNVPDGLYPNVGDAGILVLQEADGVVPGADALPVLGLDGEVVDFEILANRPDCLSIWGLARETSAVLDTYCVMPEIAVEERGGGTLADHATVEVLDDELCPRYCARVIDNVRIGPSPMWMRAQLHAAGVRPINNIVDITNYVMLETGHPMHAFDLSKVRDQHIIVRRAKPNEMLTTLDGKEHVLAEDMLVIADAQRATGLAGIMGGEDSEILPGTKRVLFECAAFDRTNNRLTSRALGIRTEASGRFEKGVRPETAMEALDRACMLVNMLECGDVVPGAFDHYPNPAMPREIEASISRINELISTNLTGDQMEDLLLRLGIDATASGDDLTAEPPAWRSDLECEADLAEEILRLHGYEHIPSTLMRGATMVGMRSDAQCLSDALKNTLVGMGWFEALSFSFVSPKWLTMLGLAEGDPRLSPVVVRNPLGEDTSVMRTTLVPSMLTNLSTNVNRGNNDVRLFELAPVFEANNPGELPDEPRMLSIGMTGESVDFYALKDAVMCLLAPLGIAPDVAHGGDAYYHPGRVATLTVDGTKLGQLGEVHPDVAAAFDMDGLRVYLAELSVEAIAALKTPVPPVKALPRYPAVSRDLALVLDESVEIGPVLREIRATGGELEGARFFDIYRGAQLGEHMKSAAFSLTFRASDRTMTESEITAAVDRVLKRVKARFDARLRQ